MRCYLLSVIIVFACIRIMAQQRFELLWQDNFDSSQINYSRWSNCYSWGRAIVANHELEYYSDGKNFGQQHGLLKVFAKKENIQGRVDPAAPDDKILEDSLPNFRPFAFTSGMLRANEKFQYGKFEIRCKLSKDNGSWPAFWLYGGQCGEIDIFEKPWLFHYSITNNLHYDSAGVACCDFRFTELEGRNTFSKEFHIYTLEWTPDSLRWFIDDSLVRTTIHHYKNCAMELICNLALADDDFWGHMPKRKKWQSEMDIDYIKVWKLKDQP